MTTEFRSAEKASEVGQALDLIDKSLGTDAADYFALLFDCPAHKREWAQVAVRDGNVVGALEIVPREMRMGQSLWPIACVCVLAMADDEAVETADGLVAQAVEHAESQGRVAVTVLGDPGLYARNGFVPVRPSYVTLVPAASVPENDSTVVVRAFEEKDIGAVRRLRAMCTQNRPWSVVRDEAWWDWQTDLWKGNEALAGWRFFSSPSDFVVAERRDEIVGYARLQAGTGDDFLLCTEVEVGDDDTEAVEALLLRMRNRAMAAQRPVIQFPAPRSIPFIAHIFDVASHHTMRPAAASMMHIVSLAGALGALVDELTARLRNSRFFAVSRRLVLGVGEEEIALRIESGRVALDPEAEVSEDEAVEVAEKAAAQMLAGYRSVRELRRAGQIEGTDEDVELLAALFPVGEPFTWGTDLLY